MIRYALGNALSDALSHKPFFTSIRVRGEEHLSPAGRTLYISNHADIVREANLINLVLRRRGLPLAAIIVGSNLYENPFTRTLMGLIPSVPVPRGLGGGLIAAKRVERALNDGQPVWIAQGQGRSKDGRNRTDKRILHGLIRASGRSIEDYLRVTRVIPVVVSAEYDPAIKGRAEQHPQLSSRHKTAYADAVSCWQGLVGQKGGVRIAFGAPLTPVQELDAAVHAIDEHIIMNYFLWKTNIVAYEERRRAGSAWLHTPVDLHYLRQAHAGLFSRIRELDEDLQPVAMSIYAMPKHERLTFR